MSFIICPKCHQMRDERRVECDKERGGCGYVDPPEPVAPPAEPVAPPAEPELPDAA